MFMVGYNYIKLNQNSSLYNKHHPKVIKINANEIRGKKKEDTRKFCDQP